MSPSPNFRIRDDHKKTCDYILNLSQQNKLNKPAKFLDYDGYPLIWSFYSRFFPVKIVISALAHIMYEQSVNVVPLKTLQTRAYDVAVALSDELHVYENESGVNRNKKKSTGLPSPPPLHKNPSPESMSKFISSKERFIQHFIGKEKADAQFFNGALNAMGLVHVSDEKDSQVSLSRKGAEFYLFSSPLIDNRNFTGPSISEQEKKFILDKIIPSFELEAKLVDSVMKTISDKNKKVQNQFTGTKELDELFQQVIRNWIMENRDAADAYHLLPLENIKMAKKKVGREERLLTSIRVATMGRLAEIGAVEWSIDKKDKKSSLFKLPSNVSGEKQEISAE